MSNIPLHPWTLDPDEAARLQENLRSRLVLTWDDRDISSIAGVDVCCVGDVVSAAIAVFHYPELTPLDAVTAYAPLRFPYLPGLLAFRIGPAILAAWQKLPDQPDLLLFHGHGIAHPRRVGLASQMGLWLNAPSIGVAKTRLYGRSSGTGPKLGEWGALLDETDPKSVIGAAVRTRENTSPVYVSAGHLIDLPHSIAFVLSCCRGYRMPEPLRVAHKVAKSPHLPLSGEHLTA